MQTLSHDSSDIQYAPTLPSEKFHHGWRNLKKLAVKNLASKFSVNTASQNLFGRNSSLLPGNISKCTLFSLIPQILDKNFKSPFSSNFNSAPHPSPIMK